MNTASARATPASSRIHSIALHVLGRVSALLACLLVACTTQPTGKAPAAIGWRATPFSDLPGWTADAQKSAWRPFVAGCSVLLARESAAPAWREVCAAAIASEPRDSAHARAFFEQHFTAYELRAADGSAKALITGYYEPLLHGSRTPDTHYRFPLYARPDDLLTVDLSAVYPELADKNLRGRVEGKRVVPYFSRSDIESGKAHVAGKELVYVDDAFEAFSLQIQGSGRVELPDKSVVRLGYADQNGWPYRSIGKVLVDRGELSLEQVSMQSIHQWAREHPEALPALLDENPSYVFFREIAPDAAAAIDGPIGTLGVPLAAGRVIAVDKRFIPLGSPVYVSTTWPSSGQPLSRLMLAQDTGGAISGPLRADWFWGSGTEAESEAGRMRQDGRLWVLWPKGAALPA